MFLKAIRNILFSFVNQNSTSTLENPNCLLIEKFVPQIPADLQTTTFFGGKPLAPADFEWPMRSENLDHSKPEVPLHFICQIDLSNCLEGPWSELLPKVGILYIFYALDLDDFVIQNETEPFWKFLYCANTSQSLLPATSPRPLGIIQMGGQQPVADPTLEELDRQNNVLTFVPAKLVISKKSFAAVDKSDDLEFDASTFPASIRHAKVWLPIETRTVRARLQVVRENLEAYKHGLRDDHPRVSFFKELKRRRKNLTVSEIWTELHGQWQSDLEILTARLPALIKLAKEISELGDHLPISKNLTADFKRQVDISINMLGGLSLIQAVDREARQYLLSIHSLSELPFGELDIARSKHERTTPKFNQNLLLNQPTEEFFQFRDEAFQYSVSMGWIKSKKINNDFVRLLQLESCFAGSGMMWADAGYADFFIAKKDLLSLRFDRVSHSIYGH